MSFFRTLSGQPIMPGVLQPAMARWAFCCSRRPRLQTNRLFLSAEEVKWRKPARLCDQIDIELTKARGKIGKAKGICRVKQVVSGGSDVHVAGSGVTMIHPTAIIHPRAHRADCEIGPTAS
jgi:3-hydroxymyristoyl/3-hydroxydecanoyl-(acyl carrier protein) dehydratase